MYEQPSLNLRPAVNEDDGASAEDHIVNGSPQVAVDLGEQLPSDVHPALVLMVER